jgi:hypothetical protein
MLVVVVVVVVVVKVVVEEEIWEHNDKAGILEKVADDEIPRITEY